MRTRLDPATAGLLLLPTESVTLVRLTVRVCAFVTPVPVPHLDWTTEVSLLFMSASTVTLVVYRFRELMEVLEGRGLIWIGPLKCRCC